MKNATLVENLKDIQVGNTVLIKTCPLSYHPGFSKNKPFNLSYPFIGIVEKKKNILQKLVILDLILTI